MKDRGNEKGEGVKEKGRKGGRTELEGARRENGTGDWRYTLFLAYPTF